MIASKLNIRFWKDWENGLTIASESVTHWMPLPEPPNIISDLSEITGTGYGSNHIWKDKGTDQMLLRE